MKIHENYKKRMINGKKKEKKIAATNYQKLGWKLDNKLIIRNNWYRGRINGKKSGRTNEWKVNQKCEKK